MHSFLHAFVHLLSIHAFHCIPLQSVPFHSILFMSFISYMSYSFIHDFFLVFFLSCFLSSFLSFLLSFFLPSLFSFFIFSFIISLLHFSLFHDFTMSFYFILFQFTSLCFAYSVIHIFHPFIHSSIHPFIHSFIHSSIHSHSSVLFGSSSLHSLIWIYFDGHDSGKNLKAHTWLLLKHCSCWNMSRKHLNTLSDVCVCTKAWNVQKQANKRKLFGGLPQPKTQLVMHLQTNGVVI